MTCAAILGTVGPSGGTLEPCEASRATRDTGPSSLRGAWLHDPISSTQRWQSRVWGIQVNTCPPYVIRSQQCCEKIYHGNRWHTFWSSEIDLQTRHISCSGPRTNASQPPAPAVQDVGQLFHLISFFFFFLRQVWRPGSGLVPALRYNTSLVNERG